MLTTRKARPEKVAGLLGAEIARYQLDPGNLRLLAVPAAVQYARLSRLYYEVLYKASNN